MRLMNVRRPGSTCWPARMAAARSRWLPLGAATMRLEPSTCRSSRAQVSQAAGEVDAVLPNLARRFIVPDAPDFAPDIGVAAALLGDGIRPGVAGIAEDLEALVIMVCKERKHESSDGVGAQIRRDITDAQPAIR